MIISWHLALARALLTICEPWWLDTSRSQDRPLVPRVEPILRSLPLTPEADRAARRRSIAMRGLRLQDGRGALDRHQEVAEPRVRSEQPHGRSYQVVDEGRVIVLGD